jgi:transcriptional regulator NrdR family protein|tara:strand:+ start:335 stop:469 length:135 start_codon:yes stop_codon:yes gene_type:complete
MQKLINAIAQAVVKRILSEDQKEAFIDLIVDQLIQRLQDEFGES